MDTKTTEETQLTDLQICLDRLSLRLEAGQIESFTVRRDKNRIFIESHVRVAKEMIRLEKGNNLQ